jgi:hypothetical protein
MRPPREENCLRFDVFGGLRFNVYNGFPVGF